MVTNQRFHLAAIPGFLFEEKRRGGFGPDDKIRFVSGLAGQTGIAIECLLTVRGIPFMRLIDVGLNQADRETTGMAFRCALRRMTP